MDLERLLFERNTALYFPDLTSSLVKTGRDAGRRYKLEIKVPHFETRRVQIVFRKGSPRLPRVSVDGPSTSKHRFASGDLCIWHPDDPVENRWVFEDGLMALIGHITLHLFREAWWRETGEWLGPEADHRNHALTREDQET